MQGLKRFKNKTALLFAAALLAASLPAAAGADDSDPAEFLTEEGRTWNITADKITYDADTDQYTATGNVEIIQGEKQLVADTVVVRKKDMTADAFGNVTLLSGQDRLTGHRMDMDLETGTGSVYQGHVFIRENNFYIRGEKIEKTGEDSYHVTRGSLTSCDGPDPDWQITGRTVDVTIEGYGFASHAAFRAKRLPLLYTPWFMFPVKLERQSGLLIPRAGYSSRNGFHYTQPFFWAISDSTDATFYYRHIAERGEKFGVEYRYVLSDNSRGTFMADGLKDRRIDDGTPEATDKWGYEDSAIRPNEDRYWIRMKADQQLPWKFDARLDADVLSDQDYLREFSSGYTGYSDTESEFSSEFGRDIDDQNDPVRTNRLNVNRTWSYHSLNTDLVWYDDVIKRRLRDEDDTLQQLPRIHYSALKQPVADSVTRGLLFGTLESGYTYFYRQDPPANPDKSHTGHRLDLHPRLYVPIKAGSYFTLEPSAGFRQTAWYIDADRDFYGQGKDRYMHRQLYDLELELTTDINRVFDFGKGRVEKIKHVVIPRLAYGYIPETDQSEYPDFDQTDRIDPQNRLALSFTSLFTSKTALAGNDSRKEPEYSYNRFARFFIEQAYDFRQKSGDPAEAWGPLYTEIELTPAELLNFKADASWNHQSDKLDSANISSRIYNRRGDELKTEYRYTRRENRDSFKSLYLSGETPVTSRLTLFGTFERNL
ncbi:MAG: LPS-assembly protein LptD, partial [Desulfosalsimonas sp.]